MASNEGTDPAPATATESTAAAARAAADAQRLRFLLSEQQYRFPGPHEPMLRDHMNDLGRRLDGLEESIRICDEVMILCTLPADAIADITAATDDDVAAVQQLLDDPFFSEQEAELPEREAVQTSDDEGRRNGTLLDEFVPQFDQVIHRVAEQHGYGYDDRQFDELVVDALEAAGLPGFPGLHAHNSNASTAVAPAAAAATETTARAAADGQAEDSTAPVPEQHRFPFTDDGEDEDMPLEDEGVVELELELLHAQLFPRFMVALRDISDLDGYANTARENVELALMASRRGRLLGLDELPSYRNGGFGAVPASAAAVACLEKRVFRAGGGGGDDDGLGGGCTICLDERFEEGQEVSVMPCSHAHAFHTQCINIWLGQSNMCPLCRHALPTS